MLKRTWISAVFAVLLAAGTVLSAQIPIVDFDQTAANWAVALHAPGVNEFSLADTTDAYQGAGSLKVTAKFLTFPSYNQAFGAAEFMFPGLLNLSGADEIRFRIKILSPSTVNRSIQWFFELTDKPAGAAENERWMYGPDFDIPYVPADDAWHLVIIPFSRLYLVPGTPSVNGLVDKESVVSLGFDLRGDGTAQDSIRFLIDDLVATKTVKEFQLVSFDDVDRNNGWQSNELNPWELTINTDDKVEGAGSLDVMMDIREFEEWGAEAEVGWGFNPLLDLTGITELRCRIKSIAPPTLVHSTRFYFWFMDQPDGEPNGEVWTTNPTYSVMTNLEEKNFDESAPWYEVIVPMDQFMFASWNADNGTVNNGVFDLNAITQISLNVGADNPPGDADAVEFLIDDLWATRGDWISVNVSDKSAPRAPADFYLDQNYPNPFNPATTLHFQIPRSGDVTLKVFDCRGTLVKTVLDGENRTRGIHSVDVDLSGRPSGIYYYSLEQDGRKQMRKMTLLK